MQNITQLTIVTVCCIMLRYVALKRFLYFTQRTQRAFALRAHLRKAYIRSIRSSE